MSHRQRRWFTLKESAQRRLVPRRSIRRVQSGLGRRTETFVPVPESDDDVGIDGGGHCPRNSRTQRRIDFRPDGIPGFPMPRYVSNGLLTLIGRTRTLVPSFSNKNLSPGPTPKARRISSGTVTCPLLVMRACFCTAHLHFLLYHKPPYSCEAGLKVLERSRFCGR